MPRYFVCYLWWPYIQYTWQQQQQPKYQKQRKYNEIRKNKTYKLNEMKEQFIYTSK